MHAVPKEKPKTIRDRADAFADATEALDEAVRCRTAAEQALVDAKHIESIARERFTKAKQTLIKEAEETWNV